MAWTGYWGPFSRKNMTGTGRFDDMVVKFLAEHNELIVASALEPGSAKHPAPACQEGKTREFADRVAAFNPNVKTIVYNANNIHQGALLPGIPSRPNRTSAPGNYMCGLDRFKKEWATTYANGTAVSFLIPEDYLPPGNLRNPHYMHNLSIAAVRDWWVGIITNETLGKNVHGAFADNGLTCASAGCHPYEDWYLDGDLERAKPLLRGQQLMLDQARAAGKYVVFNGERPVQDYAGLETLLPHADATYFEPWLGGPYRDPTTGKLNASMASHALLKMINASTTQPNKGVIFRASPSNSVSSGGGEGSGDLHTADPAELRANATKNIGFPLATFLCAAGARWKFCYAYTYSVQSYVAGDQASGNHTLAGQPLLPSWVPDNWYPELTMPPGTPLGPCTYDAATETFAREWSGVSVSLDMNTETAEFEWKNLRRPATIDL